MSSRYMIQHQLVIMRCTGQNHRCKKQCEKKEVPPAVLPHECLEDGQPEVWQHVQIIAS